MDGMNSLFLRTFVNLLELQPVLRLSQHLPIFGGMIFYIIALVL